MVSTMKAVAAAALCAAFANHAEAAGATRQLRLQTAPRQDSEKSQKEADAPVFAAVAAPMPHAAAPGAPLAPRPSNKAACDPTAVADTAYPTAESSFLTADYNGADPSVVGQTLAAPPTMYKVTRAQKEGTWRYVNALRDFIDVLNLHGVEYWLDGGTLMGAYRHGKFLPWDNDIDISIPVSEYRKLMGVVATDAGKKGLSVMRGYLYDTGYYTEVAQYIHRRCSRLEQTAKGDMYSGTLGYHAQAQRDGIAVDIWIVFPVTVNGVTLLSNAGGSTLFSRQDVYPFKDCMFEGTWYKCPQRSRRWLLRNYQRLDVPDLWDPTTCSYSSSSIDASKFLTPTPTTQPQVPQIYATSGSALGLSMHIPANYAAETGGPTCSASGSEGTAAKGTPCQFPFTYGGQTYHYCKMTPSYTPGEGWCATASTYDNNAWGSCTCTWWTGL